MGKTSIEWTDRTWNCLRGCSRISQGCVNCYAEKIAQRFSDGPFKTFATRAHGWTGKVELIEEKLNEPLHWRNPSRVFVNSMSDLFHEAVTDQTIDRVFAVMAACPLHTFQILTKRPKRMLAWFTPLDFGGRGGASDSAHYRIATAISSLGIGRTGVQAMWPLPNVWLGVSVEYQATADERIPLLSQTPGAVRFVSYEPALGPVDFSRHIEVRMRDLDSPNEIFPNWLIIGGESGPGARPFDITWARNTIRQCKAAGVACFVKQVGAKPEGPQGCGDCDPCLHGQPCMLAYNVGMSLKDRKGGDIAEWPADIRVREFPEVA